MSEIISSYWMVNRIGLCDLIVFLMGIFDGVVGMVIASIHIVYWVVAAFFAWAMLIFFGVANVFAAKSHHIAISIFIPVAVHCPTFQAPETSLRGFKSYSNEMQYSYFFVCLKSAVKMH